MRCLSIIFVFLGMLMVSCSKNDDPILPSSQYKISFIYSDETTQLFDYDSEDNIKEWQYIETKSSQLIADASYNYEADGSSISIAAEEVYVGKKWVFEEVLYLNVDGTAKSAEGTAGLYCVEDNSLLMKKSYSVIFNYNVAKQLTSIRIVEKRIIEHGDDPYPLKNNIDFEWSDNNLIESREYLNPTSPLKVCEYTYYDGAGVDFAPIIHYPILRAYYKPLQYQGRFGSQPKGLVRKSTIDNNYSTDYYYNLGNSTNSIVEGYIEKLPSGRETQYTIGWE